VPALLKVVDLSVSQCDGSDALGCVGMRALFDDMPK
jgi:hypothetical protein